MEQFLSILKVAGIQKVYLDLKPPSKRFGINPCRRVAAQAKMMFFASAILPVKMKSPGNEIKVSLPQFLI